MRAKPMIWVISLNFLGVLLLAVLMTVPGRSDAKAQSLEQQQSVTSQKAAALRRLPIPSSIKSIASISASEPNVHFQESPATTPGQTREDLWGILLGAGISLLLAGIFFYLQYLRELKTTCKTLEELNYGLMKAILDRPDAIRTNVMVPFHIGFIPALVKKYSFRKYPVSKMWQDSEWELFWKIINNPQEWTSERIRSELEKEDDNHTKRFRGQ